LRLGDLEKPPFRFTMTSWHNTILQLNRCFIQADADGTVSQIRTPESMYEINLGENDPPICPPTGVFLVSELNFPTKRFAL
jgi:hypothetical protein